MVIELRKRQQRIQFHFYFGKSLELCSTSEEWKNKFHVIHCPQDFTHFVRLQNLLPIAKQCLNDKHPESVIVTDLILRTMNGKVLTVADFIELEMTCPLTMIPTIYGLKLLDHVQLGNSTCNSLHDFFRSKTYSTVKWSMAPVTYSTNVRLELSPILQRILINLADKCFVNASWTLISGTEKNYNRTMRNQVRIFNRNTPLTFYYIMQPFFNSHHQIEDQINSICIRPNYQMAWKTLRQWMNGQEVLLYYIIDRKMLEAILKVKDEDLEVSYVQFILKPTDPSTNYRKGQVIDDATMSKFFSDTQAVYNLRWNEPNDFVFSFLLSKNHGLDKKTTKLFVLDCQTKKILYSINLSSKSMQRQLITNTNQTRFPLVQHPSNQTLPVLCQEGEDKYFLLIERTKNQDKQQGKELYKI